MCEYHLDGIEGGEEGLEREVVERVNLAHVAKDEVDAVR